MRIDVAHALTEVAPEKWDALAGSNNPFLEHAFLHTLESSGCVGDGTGWLPRHLLAWEGPTLVGAMPLYLKTDSYGEYIFDWAWAEAALRAGIQYYPKLVSAIPFTPVMGRRILVQPSAAQTQILPSLLQGAIDLQRAESASSIHILFCTQDECKRAANPDDFLPRLSHQFHWHNAGFDSFADYVATLRSSARKNVRKERRRAAESGLTFLTLPGEDLTDNQWQCLYHFYLDTHTRKWGQTYLTEAFFQQIRARQPHRILATLACNGDQPIAGALHFHKGDSLYGRYWGCLEDYDALHFELCYYRPIEYCIARGLQRFEAGAQGIHKLKRGLMPHPTYSLHQFNNQHLARAVEHFVGKEALAMRHEMAVLTHHGPFKRAESQPPSDGSP